MTKPLLSQLDIKLFILDTLNEILVKDELLSRTQLHKRLNISFNSIDEYRTYGMPCEIKHGKTKYRLRDVIKWLDLNNKKYNKKRVYEED